MRRRPHVVVLAGPNGAGKTTVAPALLAHLFHIETYVNADVIAQGLSGLNPEGAALTAGRIMLERLKTLAAQRSDFAFETTLASRSFAPFIRRLDVESTLIFLYLRSPELAVLRVAKRVAAGGHAISAEVIRRRYAAGLNNLLELYLPIVDRCLPAHRRPVVCLGCLLRRPTPAHRCAFAKR